MTWSEHPDLMRIGDRSGAFGALLPARVDGPVLLALPEPQASALRRRFPHAHIGPAHPDGPADLVVVDVRHFPLDRARASAAPDAVIAVIGVRDDLVIYPNPDHPDVVWRPGWPVPAGAGPTARLRRVVGVRRAVRAGTAGLRISGDRGLSLAEAVAADIATQVGEPLHLVGLTAASRTILRLRGEGGRELAVRVSTVDPGREVDRASTVADAVPGLARWVPEVLAQGSTHGYPWVASEWFGGRPWRARRAVRREVAAVAAEVADCLAASPTGSTGPGWARTWAARPSMLDAEQREAVVRLMDPLERGVPTGWCHGDLWAGNVILHAGGAAVIDWDLATDDAPLGLDRLSSAAHRIAAEQGVDLARALVVLLERTGEVGGDLAGDVAGDVAGAPWPSLTPGDRHALAVAAWLVHLRNRAFHDLPPDQLAAQLRTIGAT